MRKLRRFAFRSLEDQNVLVGIRKMILPANDVTDAQIDVIRARRQMIGRHPVRAQQREVFDIVGGLDLLAVHRVGEAHRFSLAARHAEPQREWLAGRRAAIALGAGEFAHAGIEQPGLVRA